VKVGGQPVVAHRRIITARQESNPVSRPRQNGEFPPSAINVGSQTRTLLSA